MFARLWTSSEYAACPRVHCVSTNPKLVSTRRYLQKTNWLLLPTAPATFESQPSLSRDRSSFNQTAKKTLYPLTAYLYVRLKCKLWLHRNCKTSTTFQFSKTIFQTNSTSFVHFARRVSQNKCSTNLLLVLHTRHRTSCTFGNREVENELVVHGKWIRVPTLHRGANTEPEGLLSPRGVTAWHIREKTRTPGALKTQQRWGNAFFHGSKLHP
jgi:hypothetical protein